MGWGIFLMEGNKCRESGVNSKKQHSMKKSFVLFFGIVISISCFSQITLFFNNKTYLVSQTSIVKDASNKRYEYSDWLSMISSGGYDIKPLDPEAKSPEFSLIPLSMEEQASRLAAAPKPIESKAFKDKKKINEFSGYDMNGSFIDTKSLKGKIIVLNFWFIRCPPCRMERPFLNKLVDEYAADSNIVFIAVSLDPKFQLDSFLKANPFKYRVVPDGMSIAGENKVEQYPTHVILDKQGKIAFNTVSYNAVTGYWMRKTIEEIKGTQ